MSELTETICALRLEQKCVPCLIPPARYEFLVKKAETRLIKLKALKPEPESPEYVEADCLISNLDEIQQRRAELIWALAYDGAGDVSLMTEREADIYRDLQGYAGELRGES